MPLLMSNKYKFKFLKVYIVNWNTHASGSGRENTKEIFFLVCIWYHGQIFKRKIKILSYIHNGIWLDPQSAGLQSDPCKHVFYL